jgi:hypothetical protein
MSKPSRAELLLKFFPEMKTTIGKGDREAAVKYNTLACEAILADQLMLFDHGYERDGLGILCLRLHKDATESSYLTLRDLEEDHDRARADHQSDLESFLADVIDQVSNTSVVRAGLVMLIDNSTAQVFQLDREYPAKHIKAMLEAL